MQKSAPTLGRVLVMAGFSFSCFGLLLFLWLSFGGPIPFKPKGYRVQISFPEATQLAEQADVRIAGVSVGKVVAKDLDPAGNRTLATVQIKPEFAPLRTDARAILRQKTLLGETYVEMTRGSKSAAAIKEGGRLANGRVVPTVELDEILRTFDPATRTAFRAWQQELAVVGKGRGKDFNDALGNLPVFTEQATDVLDVLNRRRTALRALVRNSGTVFAALSAREADLQRAITQTRVVFDTTASQRENLAQAISIFPTFEDESRATLDRLRTFASDTDPLVVRLRPVLRKLTPTVRDIGTLSPDLEHLFRSLDPLITASATGLPALSDVLRGLKPVLGAVGPFLSELNPILQYLELNQAQVSDFISVGASAFGLKLATPNPNGNGHALPQMIMAGSQSILTTTRSSDNRGNTYVRPGGLAEPRLKSDLVLASWDCNPAGGEKPPPPTSNPGETPACYVQGPIAFQGKLTRFPHVEADDYSK